MRYDWAILDSNPPQKHQQNQHIPNEGAAKSAALPDESRPKPGLTGGALADALALIARLPGLSDAEREEAVRRLLDGGAS